MRYWFLNIQVRQGEYEFNQKSVHKTPKDEEFDAEEYAKDYYGFADDPDNDDGSYYFNCGNVCVEVYKIQEITQKEYNVLNRYI